MLYTEALDRLHRIVRKFPAMYSDELTYLTRHMPVGRSGLQVQLVALTDEIGIQQPVQLRSNLSAIAYQINQLGLREEVDRFVNETFPEPESPKVLSERWVDPASAVIKLPGLDRSGGLVISIRPSTPAEVEMILRATHRRS